MINPSQSIVIEAASERLFVEQYPELLARLKAETIPYGFRQDPVGFGNPEELLIVGLVFVYESVGAGLTYEILKASVTSLLHDLSHSQRERVYFQLDDRQSGERYDLHIETTGGNIDVEIPEKLRLKISR